MPAKEACRVERVMGKRTGDQKAGVRPGRGRRKNHYIISFNKVSFLSFMNIQMSQDSDMIQSGQPQSHNTKRARVDDDQAMGDIDTEPQFLCFDGFKGLPHKHSEITRKFARNALNLAKKIDHAHTSLQTLKDNLYDKKVPKFAASKQTKSGTAFLHFNKTLNDDLCKSLNEQQSSSDLARLKLIIDAKNAELATMTAEYMSLRSDLETFLGEGETCLYSSANVFADFTEPYQLATKKSLDAFDSFLSTSLSSYFLAKADRNRSDLKRTEKHEKAKAAAQFADEEQIIVRVVNKVMAQREHHNKSHRKARNDNNRGRSRSRSSQHLSRTPSRSRSHSHSHSRRHSPKSNHSRSSSRSSSHPSNSRSSSRSNSISNSSLRSQKNDQRRGSRGSKIKTRTQTPPPPSFRHRHSNNQRTNNGRYRYNQPYRRSQYNGANWSYCRPSQQLNDVATIVEKLLSRNRRH